MSSLTIGQAAACSSVPAKTIRYYESVGLLAAPARSANGYRVYEERAVEELRFVHRARGLGFSIKDVAALLALWHDTGRRSGEVKAMALRHVADVEAKIEELQSIRRTLVDLGARPPLRSGRSADASTPPSAPAAPCACPMRGGSSVRPRRGSASRSTPSATVARLLAERCHGDHRPDCPILDELGTSEER